MITLPEKLSNMTPYDPSENIYRIKLDANESFFELPLELKDEISTGIMSVDFNRYPDPGVSAVRMLAGREYGVAAQNIMVGNGSDEILSLIMNTFVPRGLQGRVNTFPQTGQVAVIFAITALPP